VHWNFGALATAGLSPHAPSVHLNSGRINFKFGDTKSIFYLFQTDVDLWPPARADGPWTFRIHAEPARTDRPARGFGAFSARGEWRPANRSVAVDVKLDKSELGDMVTLFEGRESGLHGHLSGDAHLAGTIERIGLTGRMTVDEIHGWNQTPPNGGAWRIFLSGALDLPGQTFNLRLSTGQRDAPVEIRYRVSDYLRKPVWGINLMFSKLPLWPLMNIARNLGAQIPRDIRIDGRADGEIGFSMPNGVGQMDGMARISDVTLAAGSMPPLRISGADLRFGGSLVTLAPTTIVNENSETASFSGDADISAGVVRARLESDGMSITSLQRQVSVAEAPLLSVASSGAWSGSLQFTNAHGANDGPWTGRVHLRNAAIPFEGFSEPVRVASAEATIEGAAVALRNMTFSAGGVTAQGEYKYDPAAARHHWFRLTVPRATGDAVEKLLMPALRRSNLLNYALNLGHVPEPEWLRSMSADGTLQVAALDLGQAGLVRVAARVVWDGDVVRMSRLQGLLNQASFLGSAQIDLSGRTPRYELSGSVKSFPWRGGDVDAEGTLTASGTGSDLARDMSASGSFHARDLNLEPLDNYATIDGCFEWLWNAPNPRLKLSQLVMSSGGDTFIGSAETGDNGQLTLNVSDGVRQIQASGAFLRGDALKPLGQ
jgi:hypothetical protein